MDTLDEGLQIDRSAVAKLLADFLRLCRNKVDHFLHIKGRAFKSQGLCTVDTSNGTCEWGQCTDESLSPQWDGNTSKAKSGHKEFETLLGLFHQLPQEYQQMFLAKICPQGIIEAPESLAPSQLSDYQVFWPNT